MPLNIARAHMLRIRITADYLHVSADALGRAVAAHLGIGRCAVYLLQLGIVNIGSKGIFHSFKVCLVTISCNLHTAFDSAGEVLHELLRPSTITPAHQVTDA